MPWLSQERYSQELISETLYLAKAVSEADPGARVPACPEWTVRDLVTHIGTGHRLASGVIENAAKGKQLSGTPGYRLIPAPDDRSEWADWLMDGAERLVVVVEEYGFDGPVWTWQPAHQNAGFWLRRMLHDEIIHRFDAQAREPLAPDIAADGVDDFLLTFATKPWTTAPTPAGA